VKPDAKLQTAILASVEAQKTSRQWTKVNGAFIPHPATWLNQSRWEDEQPALPEVEGAHTWTGERIAEVERELAAEGVI